MPRPREAVLGIVNEGRYGALQIGTMEVDREISRDRNGEYFCENIANMVLKATDQCIAAADQLESRSLPAIRAAAAPLLAEGVRLPFVFNSSGYERPETLAEYHDLCDIALVDLRYADDATAHAASSAPGYVDASRAAVKHLWNALGPLDSDEPGGATRGVIVRVLVLPGHAEEAIENLAWLAAECSPRVHISVMSQYAPAFQALETPPFDRVGARIRAFSERS